MKSRRNFFFTHRTTRSYKTKLLRNIMCIASIDKRNKKLPYAYVLVIILKYTVILRCFSFSKNKRTNSDGRFLSIIRMHFSLIDHLSITVTCWRIGYTIPIILTGNNRFNDRYVFEFDDVYCVLCTINRKILKRMYKRILYSKVAVEYCCCLSNTIFACVKQ